jgi:hypothetical protein
MATKLFDTTIVGSAEQAVEFIGNVNRVLDGVLGHRQGLGRQHPAVERGRAVEKLIPGRTSPKRARAIRS